MAGREVREYHGSYAATGRGAITGWATGTSLPIRYKKRIRSLNSDGTQAYGVRSVLTFKLSKNGPDSGAAMQRVVTTTPSALGQLIDTGQVSKQAHVYFYLSGVDTTVLGTDPLYFSAVLVLSNGEHLELDSGLMLLEEGVTDSPAGAERVGQVTVTPNPLVIPNGLTQQLTAVVEDVNDVVISRLGHWWTSNPEVITVSSTGLATGVGVGTARVGFVVDDVSGFTEGSVVVDDIGILVANVGANSDFAGVYSARYNVRDPGDATCLAIEDARITDTNGQIVCSHAGGGSVDAPNWAALSGATKLTLLAWYSTPFRDGAPKYLFAPGGSIAVYQVGNSEPPDLKIDINGVNVGLLSPQPFPSGSDVKLMVVYDGTQGTNATRLRLFWAVFDWLTQTWGGLTEAVLAYPAAVPASLPAPIGGTTISTIRGAVDEIRAWNGVALTQAQGNAETLTANPVAANLRYQFAGTCANSGSDGAGMNATPSGTYVYASADRRYGPIVMFLQTRPAYDAALKTITATDAGTVAYAGGCGVGAMDGDMGIAVVGTLPLDDGGGSSDEMMGWLEPGTVNFLRAAANVTMLYNGVQASVAHAGAAGRRVFHGRHTKTGVGAGSSVSGVRIGSGAETTSAGNVAYLDLQRFYGWGRGDGGTSGYADQVVRAFALFRVAYTTAKQNAVNDWASTYEAATL